MLVKLKPKAVKVITNRDQIHKVLIHKAIIIKDLINQAQVNKDRVNKVHLNQDHLSKVPANMVLIRQGLMVRIHLGKAAANKVAAIRVVTAKVAMVKVVMAKETKDKAVMVKETRVKEAKAKKAKAKAGQVNTILRAQRIGDLMAAKAINREATHQTNILTANPVHMDQVKEASTQAARDNSMASLLAKDRINILTKVGKGRFEANTATRAKANSIRTNKATVDKVATVLMTLHRLNKVEPISSY